MKTSSGKRPPKGRNYVSNGRTDHQIWVTLKDLKNSYPVETAEYAVAMRIDKEPEFS